MENLLEINTRIIDVALFIECGLGMVRWIEVKLDLPVVKGAYISFYHLRINCTVQDNVTWLYALKYARDNERELDIVLCDNFTAVLNIYN